MKHVLSSRAFKVLMNYIFIIHEYFILVVLHLKENCGKCRNHKVWHCWVEFFY